MKTIFTKIFLAIAASFCTLVGLVLVDIGLGRVAPDRFVALYVRLFQIPYGFKTILGTGLFSILLGFVLFVIVSRTKPEIRMISVERNGKVLRVPYVTIKDFIKQIIGQNPYMNDPNVEFTPRDKNSFDITIESGFNDIPSIHSELTRVEEILRNEIVRVFDWKDYEFHFQLKEVSIDPQRRYFIDGKMKNQATVATIEPLVEKQVIDSSPLSVDIKANKLEPTPVIQIEPETSLSEEIVPEEPENVSARRFSLQSLFVGKK